jgi:hypothetical protein
LNLLEDLEGLGIEKPKAKQTMGGNGGFRIRPGTALMKKKNI